MGEFYNRWMLKDPKYLEMMKRRAAMGVPDYQLNTPSLSPDNMQNLDTSGILDSTKTVPGGGSNWMDYAGLGAMAAAPVASALLGRQAPRPEFASGSSLGSKPMYEAQSVYRPQQPRIPAFLARLLMGMK